MGNEGAPRPAYITAPEDVIDPRPMPEGGVRGVLDELRKENGLAPSEPPLVRLGPGGDFTKDIRLNPSSRSALYRYLKARRR